MTQTETLPNQEPDSSPLVPLLRPTTPSTPIPPKVLSEETERKLQEIIAHFSTEGYELPLGSTSVEGESNENAGLTEREMMFLVSIPQSGKIEEKS